MPAKLANLASLDPWAQFALPCLLFPPPRMMFEIRKLKLKFAS